MTRTARLLANYGKTATSKPLQATAQAAERLATAGQAYEAAWDNMQEAFAQDVRAMPQLRELAQYLPKIADPWDYADQDDFREGLIALTENPPAPPKEIPSPSDLSALQGLTIRDLGAITDRLTKLNGVTANTKLGDFLALWTPNDLLKTPYVGRRTLGHIALAIENTLGHLPRGWERITPKPF